MSYRQLLCYIKVSECLGIRLCHNDNCSFRESVINCHDCVCIIMVYLLDFFYHDTEIGHVVSSEGCCYLSLSGALA